jgi:hypothetical protein
VDADVTLECGERRGTEQQSGSEATIRTTQGHAALYPRREPEGNHLQPVRHARAA